MRRRVQNFISALFPRVVESVKCYYVPLHACISLQKQICHFSKLFGYYNCVTILTMQIYECSIGKEFMQWELILE